MAAIIAVLAATTAVSAEVSESTMRIINFVSPSCTQRKPGGAQDVASAGETKRGHREY